MKIPFSVRPGISGRSLRLGLALGLAVPGLRGADDAAGEARPAPAAAAPAAEASATPAAIVEADSALAAAKVTEEGDRDLDRAAREYHAIIERYDADRRRAAEALFRFAEVTRKLGRIDEAKQAYTRVVREFRGVGGFASSSQSRLNEVDPNAAQPKTYRMSPELMRRYGLIPRTPAEGVAQESPATEENPPPPPATTSEAAAPALPPEMMARYGMGPGASSRTRYGGPTPSVLGDIPGRYSAAAAPDELTTLRTEAAELAARLRKIRREARALAFTPDSLPVSLIEDPELVSLIREQSRSQVKLETVRVGAGADAGTVREAEQAVMAAQKLVEKQVEIARRRMESAEKLMVVELRELEEQMTQLKSERAKSPGR